MYHMHMIRINRSPDGGEGNGGAGTSGDISASGGAGEGGADTGSAGGSAAPEYLSKSDFESKWSELQSTLSRLTPAERREERQEKSGKPEAPKRPNPKDYDFQKDPSALERYEDAISDFNYSKYEAKRAEAETARQAEEKMQANVTGHNQRIQEYRKENPSFDADMKSTPIRVTDPVAAAVYASKKNGVLAVHYMAKNPGTDQELNLLASTDGPEAVRERIGEMAHEMRAEQKLSEGNIAAAGARPPRQSLKGGAGGSDGSSKDYGSIFKNFRK